MCQCQCHASLTVSACQHVSINHRYSGSISLKPHHQQKEVFLNQCRYSCNQDGPARSRRRRRIQRWLPARALRRVVLLSLVGQQTWYCLHRVHHEDCQNAMTSSVHHMSAESESRRPPHREVSDAPSPLQSITASSSGFSVGRV